MSTVSVLPKILNFLHYYFDFADTWFIPKLELNVVNAVPHFMLLSPLSKLIAFKIISRSDYIKSQP